MDIKIELTELIEKFQILNEKKLGIIKEDEILQKEIMDRLQYMSKKEFFMSIVNVNPKNNKKISFNFIQEEGNINDFLKDYNILNGFFKFLPTYKNKRIPTLNKNIDEASVIVRKVIEQFSPLVKNIISTKFLKKYSYMANNYNELYAGGITGLVAAIYKFDTKRGVQFITHAYKWITYYIFREMDDIVKTYNDKLYDDDGFFDTLQTEDDFEENILNSVEIEKLKKTDILDKHEERLLDLVLVEKVKLEDISKVTNKLSAYMNNDIELFYQYLKA